MKINQFQKITLAGTCVLLVFGAQAAFARCEPGVTCRSFLGQTLDAIRQSMGMCVTCSVTKDRGQAGFALDCKIRCAMRSGAASGDDGSGAQSEHQPVRMPAYVPAPQPQAMPPAPPFWNTLFLRR